MPGIEIIGWERGFSRHPTRQGLFDRYVTYRRDDGSLGFADTPDEGFTKEKAMEAVRQVEAERRLAAPIKFNL